jgi:hypothetical protein
LKHLQGRADKNGRNRQKKVEMFSFLHYVVVLYMTITLSPTLKALLLANRKESTVNTYMRQLKCLGLSNINEQTLKGNIKNIVDTFMTKGYSTPKVYINALLNVYQVSDYDADELEYLKSEFNRICEVSDKTRQTKKEQSNTVFSFDWDDLQRTYQHWEDTYNETPTLHNLTNWFIIALISDEEFGVKRSVDIINLTKANIKDDTIAFKAQKNKFVYQSLSLSQHILKPMHLLMIQNRKQTLILTPGGVKYNTNNFLFRLKEVLRSDINSQYLRRLWASYHYSKHPTAKQLLRQAYELNHSIDIHLSDYVSEYETGKIKFIREYRFKKRTTWIRC